MLGAIRTTTNLIPRYNSETFGESGISFTKIVIAVLYHENRWHKYTLKLVDL